MTQLFQEFWRIYMTQLFHHFLQSFEKTADVGEFLYLINLKFHIPYIDIHQNQLLRHFYVQWLRFVGSLKLLVSFAEYSLFYRALLQKRPIILRSLLIVATTHVRMSQVMHSHTQTMTYMRIRHVTHTHTQTVTYTRMSHVTHTHARRLCGLIRQTYVCKTLYISVLVTCICSVMQS